MEARHLSMGWGSVELQAAVFGAPVGLAVALVRCATITGG